MMIGINSFLEGSVMTMAVMKVHVTVLLIGFLEMIFR
jgi:hypothetical protein